MKKTIAKVKAVTKALSSDQYPELGELPEKKAAQLKLLKKGAFGYDHGIKADDSATKLLLSDMLGIDKAYLCKRPLLDFKPFSAVVAITTTENADGTKTQKDVDGTVMVLMNGETNGTFMLSDGSPVICPSRSRKKVRPATAAEIDNYFDEMQLFRAEV